LNTLKNDLRAITADGTACNVMVGVGETYLPAFVLALTGSQLACGLTATVPLVMGAFLQLLAPYAIPRLRSFRRWVVLCAVVQAASFLPLLVVSLAGSASVFAVFCIIAIYWATGQAGGSAWNAWVEDLVPEPVRAKFFADRTRFVQLGLVVGFVSGGILLQIGKLHGYVVLPFAALFFAAIASRLVSAYKLNSQSDISLLPKKPSVAPWADFWAIATQGGNGRVIVYVLAMQLACQISGPYFTPYMLGHLKLSYLGYVTLICVAYLARIAAAPTWGRVVEKIGVNRLLWMSGLGIVPMAFLWGLSDSFTYLVILQIVSGAVWGAYELANLLLIIEAIPTAKKINVLTVYNFVNALAIMGGSFIGGYLLTAFGGGYRAYFIVFLASSVARLMAPVLLVKVPRWMPVFGGAKKVPALTSKSASPSVQRHVVKPLPAKPHVHGSHPAIPKPAFLRVSPTAASEKKATK
jgi:MFS family permease